MAVERCCFNTQRSGDERDPYRLRLCSRSAPVHGIALAPLCPVECGGEEGVKRRRKDEQVAFQASPGKEHQREGVRRAHTPR